MMCKTLGICHSKSLDHQVAAAHPTSRTSHNADEFCRNFSQRLARMPQISTDGLSSYAMAIGFALGSEDVDYERSPEPSYGS